MKLLFKNILALLICVSGAAVACVQEEGDSKSSFSFRPPQPTNGDLIESPRSGNSYSFFSSSEEAEDDHCSLLSSEDCSLLSSECESFMVETREREKRRSELLLLRLESAWMDHIKPSICKNPQSDNKSLSKEVIEDIMNHVLSSYTIDVIAFNELQKLTTQPEISNKIQSLVSQGNLRKVPNKDEISSAFQKGELILPIENRRGREIPAHCDDMESSSCYSGFSPMKKAVTM